MTLASRIGLRTAFLALALLAAPPGFAFTPEEQRAERERIKAEREQADAAYAVRERECRERFVVTSCIDDAKRERRRTLERLRQEQGLLDEMQRKQRAAQRLDEIRGKLAAEDGPPRQPVAREPRKPRARTEVIERAPPASSAAAPAASASAAEAKKRADHERRLREAQAHREEVERRNAERKASGKKPAAPLPVPAAASR